jgi:hypothetical protein
MFDGMAEEQKSTGNRGEHFRRDAEVVFRAVVRLCDGASMRRVTSMGDWERIAGDDPHPSDAYVGGKGQAIVSIPHHNYRSV